MFWLIMSGFLSNLGFGGKRKDSLEDEFSKANLSDSDEEAKNFHQQLYTGSQSTEPLYKGDTDIIVQESKDTYKKRCFIRGRTGRR